MYTITCLHCDRTLRIREDVGKTKMKCRFCGAIFVGSTQPQEAPPIVQPARAADPPTDFAVSETVEASASSETPSREALTVHARSAGTSKDVTPRPNVAPREQVESASEPAVPVAAAESAGAFEPPPPQEVHAPAVPTEPPAPQSVDEPLPVIETPQPEAPSPQPSEATEPDREPEPKRCIPAAAWIGLLLLCLAAAGVGLLLLIRHADAAVPASSAAPQLLCPPRCQIPLDASPLRLYDWDRPPDVG